MKKNIFILLLIAIFFSGCLINKPQVNISHYYKLQDTILQIKIAELKHIKDFELPIENSKYNIVNDAQIIETDSGLVYIATFSHYDKISFYNLETKRKFKEIDMHGKELVSFYYINNDSIMLFISPRQNIYYDHDTSLVLINDKGKILKSYSWLDAPVWSIEKERDYKDSVSFATLFFQKLAYSNQKILIPFTRFTQKMFGDSVYLNKREIVGCLETKENKFYPTNIKYPSITGHYYYPLTFFSKLISVSHDNEFHIAFNYTSEFYKYNSNTNKIKKYSIKSSVLDTIFPFYTEKKPKDYKIPLFIGLKYNKYQNLYFRSIALHPIYGRGTFVVADTNYNFVAEGIHPQGIGRFYFTKDYILAQNITKTSETKGKIILSAFKLKYKKGTNQELIYDLQTNNNFQKTEASITNYFNKNLKIKEKNYSATILALDFMCYGTVDFVIKHYIANKKKYEKNNVYLILSGNNQIQIQENLKQNYNINSSSNILIVPTIEYMPFLKFEPMHPRVISVRNNKVVYDSVFIDDAIDTDFQIKLLNLCKEQSEL